MATSDLNGRCDVSPKGDAPGFVHVLDERRLAIPDRPGNKRLDGLTNLIANPHVGLIFLVPGRHETLRDAVCSMRGADLATLNEAGNRWGSWVASQSGAMPPLDAQVKGRIESSIKARAVQ